MSPAEEINQLRRIALKSPRISVRRAMQLIREREAIRATTERLRAESAAKRQAVPAPMMDGATEWIA